MRHNFYAYVVRGLWHSKWKCRNCGVKVNSYTVAKQLEGLECY